MRLIIPNELLTIHEICLNHYKQHMNPYGRFGLENAIHCFYEVIKIFPNMNIQLKPIFVSTQENDIYYVDFCVSYPCLEITQHYDDDEIVEDDEYPNFHDCYEFCDYINNFFHPLLHTILGSSFILSNEIQWCNENYFMWFIENEKEFVYHHDGKCKYFIKDIIHQPSGMFLEIEYEYNNEENVEHNKRIFEPLFKDFNKYKKISRLHNNHIITLSLQRTNLCYDIRNVISSYING